MRVPEDLHPDRHNTRERIRTHAVADYPAVFAGPGEFYGLQLGGLYAAVEDIAHAVAVGFP